MKRVVSVSLGSSKRNKASTFELLGEEFSLERIGTDGDKPKFIALMNELDGNVDALGIGGADLYLFAGQKRYVMTDIAKLVRGVTKTPVVDGSGLKHTLERASIEYLQANGIVDFAREKVLLTSAADRYGMAQALDQACPDCVYGDFIVGLGLPILMRKYSQVKLLGSILLPIISKLPIEWVYPTGAKQESREPKFPKLWADRTFICGDSLYILRHMPDEMPGATILTQSVRERDIEFFRKAGIRRVITTTPVIGGETFATNVMEAALVAHLGKRLDEMPEQETLDALARIGWKPNVIDLS